MEDELGLSNSVGSPYLYFRWRYHPLHRVEFKRQALKRADEPGVTDALVCEELRVSTRQLRRWRDAVEEHGAQEAFPQPK